METEIVMRMLETSRNSSRTNGSIPVVQDEIRIHQLELYAIGIGLSLFTEELEDDTWVVIATDNMTAYHWIQNMKANNTHDTDFIRNMVLMSMHWRIRINITWIRTYANQEADTLSRIKMESINMISEDIIKSCM